MKTVLVPVTFAFALTMSTVARADECATDADCPAGYDCEEVAWGACPGTPPCMDGEDCPEPEPCEEGSEWVCVVAPEACTSDSDCTDGFECVSFSYTSCSTEGADPTDSSDASDSSSSGSDTPGAPGADDSSGSEDEPPSPEDDADSDHPADCETVTEAYCAPPYVGGCEVDADCGEGFTCAELENCACSGSGAIPPSDGGGSADDPDGEPTPDDSGFEDPSCECSGSGEFYCEPLEMECGADEDCPTDWTCESFGRGVSETCYETESGEVICETDEGTAEHYCVPPAWDAWGGVAEGAEAPTAATDDFSGRGSDEGGIGDGDGEAGPVSVPARAGDEAGCTAAGGRTGGALGLLVALTAFARRRR